MDIHWRNSGYKNWTYYKVEYVIKQHLTEDGRHVLQTHKDDFWTPYGQFIDSEVEERAEQTGWKLYSWEWEIVEEKNGIPSRENYPHMIMEV